MVSTSNKRSLRIRTGPHDYGPREWCVFFFFMLRDLALACERDSIDVTFGSDSAITRQTSHVTRHGDGQARPMRREGEMCTHTYTYTQSCTLKTLGVSV